MAHYCNIESQRRPNEHQVGLRWLLRSLILAALLLPIVHSRSLAQELDSARQHRLPSCTELVWDNVTNNQQIIRGIKPDRKQFGDQLSMIELHPGEWSEFYVPPHEVVRVVTFSKSLNAGDVEIWTSNGSGLYRKIISALSDDGRTAIAAPDNSELSTARVGLAVDAACPIKLAIFTSRRMEPQRLNYYQCRVIGKNCGVMIRDNKATTRIDYTELGPGKINQIRLKQPTRLRIESRFKYDRYSARRETFWLKVKINGQLQRVLTFDTVPQLKSRIFVDGCEQLVGIPEFAYVDVDCRDAKVTIESSHAVYMRADGVGLDLCRSTVNRIYKLPVVDRELQIKSMLDSPEFDPTRSHLSRHFLNSSENVSAELERSVFDPYLSQQQIRELARSNHAKQGGLRAYMWMRAIATLHYGDAEHRQELSVTELAQRYRNYYTFFRDLLPQRLQVENEMSIVDYRRRQLRNGRNKFTEIVLGENHIGESFETIKSATLFKQSKYDPELVYYPEQDLGTSLLRIVVDRQRLAQACKLYVQYDDGAPIEFWLEECAAVAPEKMMPGRDEAALAGLKQAFGRYDRGVLGGPYSQWKTPHPVTLAATSDLILPDRVTQIRIWVDGPDTASAYVGVQALNGRDYKLSEQAHRYLRSKRIDSSSSEFQEFVWSAIDNETYGLQQLLRSLQFTFSAGIESPETANEPTDVWDNQKITNQLQQAQVFADQQQWPSAIESLSQIIRHSTGKLRQDAIVARVNALFSADESYLATVEATGWFTYTDDPQFRAQLIETLTRESGFQNDARRRERFAAMAALNIGNETNSLALAEEFIANRRYLFALMTLTTLRSDSNTEDLILRCTYQLGWWKLFEETLANIKDSHKQYKWRGLMHLKRGNYLKAKQQLTQAGDAGLAWLEHWKKGDQIFHQLDHRNKDLRLKAIDDWRSWQRSNPGPKQWIVEPQCISQSSGNVAINSTIAGTHMQYFRSAPDNPAQIQVEGPCQIKIEARPIHPTGENNEPLSDWLVIHNHEQSELIPIINNFPSRTLKTHEESEASIGGLVEAEIQIPAGRNLLKINAEKYELLFRIKVLRPEIPLSILPLLNEFTFDSLRSGKFSSCQSCASTRTASKNCVRLICRDASCRSTSLGKQCVCSELQLPPDQTIAANLPFHVQSQDNALRDASAALRRSQLAGYYRYEAPITPLMQIQEILLNNPGRQDIHAIYRQIKQQFTWERFRQFDSQAGIHTIGYSGWSPEAPATRIRKALMSQWNWEYALLSSNDLEIDVDSEFQTNCRITLQRPRVSFLPVTDSTVRCFQSDDDSTIAIYDPRQQIELDTQLAPGSQRITLRQLNPTANHIVGVNIHEVLKDGQLVPFADVNGNNKERIFQVATFDEPLEFRVSGPTIIRIDQSDKDLNMISSKTIPISGAEREFKLFPDEGREQGYFRIFELVPGTHSSKSYRADPVPSVAHDNQADEVVEGVIEQVAYLEEIKPLDTLSLRSPDDPPATLEINDYNELGYQERGTWFLDVGYQIRRSLAEAPRPVESGRFMDLYLGRYFYNPWNETYSLSRFLARPRIENGTTFGFQNRGSTTVPFAKCQPDVRANGWGQYRFSWNGYGFIQNAGTPLRDDVSSNPWIVGGWLRLARRRQINEHLSRRPTLTAFGRYLSEDRNGFQAGDLDQDVFTPYKRNHRYGLRISDTFTRQTRLDKRFWFRPYLVTNEDQLVPDNLGFQTGSDQLIGPLQLNLSYRFTRYLSDNDRELSSLQNVVNLQAVYERWHSYRRRSEVRFSIQHDVDDDEGTSFSFNFVNYFNHGRGYRDFDPNQLQFKALKEHRAARHYHSLRK